MGVYNVNGSTLSSVYGVGGNTLSHAYSINGVEVFPDEPTPPTPTPPEYKDIADLILLKSGISGTLQGACTDGTYIYGGFSSSSMVYKYNILTKEVVTQTYDISFNHANDITYNPNTGYIYITNMGSSGAIHVIDADTLEYVDTIVPYKNGAIHTSHGIAYDRIHDQYITADVATEGKNYSVFDSNWNYIRTIIVERDESYVLQGIETDGTYIYRALWDKTNGKNYIYIYDFNANFVDSVEIPYNKELEDIMYDWNGSWYVDYYLSGNACRLYYCQITEELTAEGELQLERIKQAYNVG